MKKVLLALALTASMSAHAGFSSPNDQCVRMINEDECLTQEEIVAELRSWGLADDEPSPLSARSKTRLEAMHIERSYTVSDEMQSYCDRVRGEIVSMPLSFLGYDCKLPNGRLVMSSSRSTNSLEDRVEELEARIEELER